MISSVYELVDYMEKNYAERIAFRWVDDETEKVCSKTYREYTQDIQKYAAFLKKEIPEIEGKHIGILARNSYHYSVVMWAILFVKAVAVPLNLQEVWQSVSEQMKRAEIDCLLSDGEYESIHEMKTSDFDICVKPIDAYLAEVELAEEEAAIEENAPAILMFTSGTTSESKCVEISHKNIFAALEYMFDLHVNSTCNMTENPLRALHMMPMHHTIGLVSLLIWCSKGEVINMCTNLRHLARDNMLMESDYTVAVPIVLNVWYKELCRGRKKSLGSLKTILCGGASVAPEIFQKLIESGIWVVQSYGLTETTAFSIYNVLNRSEKYASIGRPGVGVRMKIDAGEICLKSNLNFLGYYKNPEATAEAIDADGWLHTGDLGYMDEDGYVYLTGRKKNLIILSSGENVSPEELESLLLQNSAVLETVVKEKNGKICAEIYCEEAQQEILRDYVTEVNRGLAMYKRMTMVEFRTEPFPRTASGKIKRT